MEANSKRPGGIPPAGEAQTIVRPAAINWWPVGPLPSSLGKALAQRRNGFGKRPVAL